MSRKEVLELGPSPAEEDCAQVGAEDYGARAPRECRAYARQLLRHAERAGLHVPEGVTLFVKANRRDYGTYHEVAVRFPEGEPEAVDVAFWFEAHQPAKWDAEARAELGLPAEEGQ